jgi:hypothetical protein
VATPGPKSIASLAAFLIRLGETGHELISLTCGSCGERQHQIVKLGRALHCLECGHEIVR